MRARKYLDNLTDELYSNNFFDKMRKGMRKVGLIALIAATIGVGSYLGLGYARGEEVKPVYQSKIAFSSTRHGNDEIYVMNADGSGQTNLTKNPASDSSPSWSPDGKKIAFDSDRDGDREIYAMNADGSEQTNLTNNPAVDGGPAWAPDGKKIAFSSESGYRHGVWKDPLTGELCRRNYEIYVMNADGSGRKRLTRNHAVDDVCPSWSPDGNKIAFSSKILLITFSGAMENPNTGEIYYSIDPNLKNLDIHNMNADGTIQEGLTENSVFDGNPCWSPDGKKIAFDSDRDGDREIYAMNADGSNVKRLTSSPAFDWHPCWSPDGKKIAFASERDGNAEIYVMNADGSEQTRLTNNPAYDAYPSWSPFLKSEK